MQPVEIQSGLNTIRLLDTICSWDDNTISARRQFQGELRFCLMEACAQLCALHVRRCNEFECHAFLLSVSSIAPLPPDRLHGTGRFEAHLKGRSRQAFSYEAAIRLEGHEPIQADLTIGTIDYGPEFNRIMLRRHYRKIFSSLCQHNSMDGRQ